MLWYDFEFVQAYSFVLVSKSRDNMVVRVLGAVNFMFGATYFPRLLDKTGSWSGTWLA